MTFNLIFCHTTLEKKNGCSNIKRIKQLLKILNKKIFSNFKNCFKTLMYVVDYNHDENEHTIILTHDFVNNYTS